VFEFSNCVIFSAQRYAKRGICHRGESVRLCVCVCVCVCHTLVLYQNKTAKRRITQIKAHNSPLTRFLTPKFTAKFDQDHPLRGRQMQVGWVKIRHLRQKMHYNSKTRKRYKTDA